MRYKNTAARSHPFITARSLITSLSQVRFYNSTVRDMLEVCNAVWLVRSIDSYLRALQLSSKKQAFAVSSLLFSTQLLSPEVRIRGVSPCHGLVLGVGAPSGAAQRARAPQALGRSSSGPGVLPRGKAQSLQVVNAFQASVICMAMPGFRGCRDSEVLAVVIRSIVVSDGFEHSCPPVCLSAFPFDRTQVSLEQCGHDGCRKCAASI